MDQQFEDGLRIRKQVMGEDFVDAAFDKADAFTLPLQEFITRNVKGEYTTEFEGYEHDDSVSYSNPANLKRVHDAGIPVVLGTDAGNPLTLHGPAVYPELEAMAAAGLTPMQVLVAATRDAARAMGRDDIGTLEVGRAADLVVLDGDPLADVANLRRVRLVARAGEIRTREELEYR